MRPEAESEQANGDRTFRPSADVMFREVGGEAVLLDLAEGRYYGLDDIGCRIWRLIDSRSGGPDCVGEEEIILELLREYEVEEEILRRDVGELLRELEGAGLVVDAAFRASPLADREPTLTGHEP